MGTSLLNGSSSLKTFQSYLSKDTDADRWNFHKFVKFLKNKSKSLFQIVDNSPVLLSEIRTQTVWNLHKFVKLLKLKASHESKDWRCSRFIIQSYALLYYSVICIIFNDIYEMFCLNMYFSIKTNCFACMFDQVF